MNSTRWGILGAGFMAELFVEALLPLAGAKVQAVATRAQDRADSFAARFRLPMAFQDFDRLLQEPAIDVVYISTPNEYHAEHCLKAIAAGKSVLCEKPFALTSKQGQEVVNLARSRGVFCMEAMWMRFAPAVREALTLARTGKLGNVQVFSAQLGFPYQADSENRLFRQPGGGSLLNLGVYPLSLAQALLGSPASVISSATLAASGVDEQFAAVLNYKDGQQSVVAASLKAKLQNSAYIHGRSAVLQMEEPLYFPERYRLVDTPLNKMERRGLGKLAKLRRYPLLRTLADLRTRPKSSAFSRRTSQSGYSFEAAEVQRCLHAGLRESPEMPLTDTLAVLELMDSIRSEWGR